MGGGRGVGGCGEQWKTILGYGSVETHGLCMVGDVW